MIFGKLQPWQIAQIHQNQNSELLELLKMTVNLFQSQKLISRKNGKFVFKFHTVNQGLVVYLTKTKCTIRSIFTEKKKKKIEHPISF